MSEANDVGYEGLTHGEGINTLCSNPWVSAILDTGLCVRTLLESPSVYTLSRH